MELRIENVSKSYDKNVLNNISLELKDQGVIAIIGPSGGGKSTLLRLLSGIEEVDAGDIYVNNYHLAESDLKDYHKKIGFVFQKHNLFPHLTVLENITLILTKIHKYTDDDANEIALKLLKDFGLIDHINKFPNQISGGQSQRVSIVRSLAINPDLLFFDEPTSSLDPILTFEVLNTIINLKNRNKDFIIVTHEIGFAKNIADYVLFIDEGDIIEHGPVSILNEPKSEQLKQFLSKVLVWR